MDMTGWCKMWGRNRWTYYDPNGTRFTTRKSIFEHWDSISKDYDTDEAKAAIGSLTVVTEIPGNFQKTYAPRKKNISYGKKVLNCIANIGNSEGSTAIEIHDELSLEDQDYFLINAALKISVIEQKIIKNQSKYTININSPPPSIIPYAMTAEEMKSIALGWKTDSASTVRDINKRKRDADQDLEDFKTKAYGENEVISTFQRTLKRRPNRESTDNYFGLNEKEFDASIKEGDLNAAKEIYAELQNRELAIKDKAKQAVSKNKTNFCLIV